MYSIAMKSDVGRKRKINEDAIASFHNTRGLISIMLADGMGGMQSGDVASKVVISQMGHAFETSSIDELYQLEDWFIQNIKKQNKNILLQGSKFKDLEGMGTTFVSAIPRKNKLLTVHIGDSRAYVFRNGKLIQLTEDHSFVNELVKNGQLTPEAAKSSPQKNILTRAIGANEDAQPEVQITDIENGDLILLTSDGLTNMISEEKIVDILSSKGSLEDLVDQLIDASNQAGGEDNISAILMYNGEYDAD